MERDTKKRHLPFLTAQAKAAQLYALDMTKDDFIEMAYDIWRDIGNIATKLLTYYITVPEDRIIELPPFCEFIDSVTAVDRPINTGTIDSGGYKNRQLPAYQVRSNQPTHNQSLTFSAGISVNYITLDDNSIEITSSNLLGRELRIVYRAIDSDKEGLPYLNDKEVAAIAAEAAKRNAVRRGFQGVGAKDKNQMAMLQYITGEATRLMTAAKIDENINDDALDKLLDIKTTWDRKVFGKRFAFQR